MSIRGIFPGILIGLTLNQQAWSVVLHLIGRTTLWFTTLAAAVIVLSTFRQKRWILFVISFILLSKAGRVVIGDDSIFASLYNVSIGVLYCGAGAAVVLQNSRLIYRQVMLFSLLSIPLMILQILGFWEWPYFLRGEFNNYIAAPTLFVDENIIIKSFQSRPSGLLYTNVFTVIIIMFALALHYGRIKTRKLILGDVLLCAFTVLAMAKTAFLAFAVIILCLLICGDSWKRQKMIKVTALFFALVTVYAFFFPGNFTYNTSWNLLRTNFIMRVSALDARMRGNTLSEITIQDSEGVPHEYILGDDPQSGYGEIGDMLPYVIVAAFFILPLWYRGFKKLRCHRPELTDSTILSLFVVILIPITASFWGSVIIWFIAGFGLLPLFLLLNPYSFRPPLKYRQ
ncbi:MAG: hypothetical protein JW920_06495 [Deltaproteobacteria bacterium]|nr:hypothetical protein [Deltaproteobacteria bacterium]